VVYVVMSVIMYSSVLVDTPYDIVTCHLSRWKFLVWLNFSCAWFR
jgi:hypothetical protein